MEMEGAAKFLAFETGALAAGAETLSGESAGSYDASFPDIYDELRSIARSHWRRVRSQDVLQTTALVHEVYLRMSDPARFRANDRNHLLALAAKTLHRIIIDHLRSLRTERRGGAWQRISLPQEISSEDGLSLDLLALEAGLARLKERKPRLAQVVELRFFGGLSVEETAGVLGVSARTVKDDWVVARAILVRDLCASEPAD